MIRKIIIYVSIFAIFAGCLVLPVSASGYDGSIIDLLPASDYSIRYSSGDYFSSDSPSGNTGGVSNATVRWNNSAASVDLSYIYINIRSNEAPSTVRLGVNGESQGTAMTSRGSYDGLYQYELPISDFTFTEFSLRIYFGSATNVDFLVESCYGLRQSAIPIPYMNHNTYYVDFMHIDGTSSTQPVQRHVEGGVVTLPYTMDFRREVWNVTANEWVYTQNTFEFYPSNIQLNNFSKMTLLLYSNDIHNVTASINSGGVKEVLPVSINTQMMASKWPGLTSELYYYWENSFYEVEIDLTGYDLHGTNTCIYIYFNGEPDYYFSYSMYWYCQIVGAWVEPVLIDTPWYQTMWNWISGGFDRVVDALQALAGDPTGGVMQDAANDMKDQADQMDAANEVMNNVSRPDVDPDQLLGDSLDFSPGGMMVLSSLTNNPIITSLLIAVCSFALIGYIFFGKR